MMRSYRKPRNVVREIERGPHGRIMKCQLMRDGCAVTTNYVVHAPRDAYDGDTVVTITSYETLVAARIRVGSAAA